MHSRIFSLSADKDWEATAVEACRNLSCRVETSASLVRGWEAISRGRLDLILLDVDHPSVERLCWFRLLRRTESGWGVAAILASSRRDENEIVAAFDLRADDFVPKDCDPAELAARIRAVLRRKIARERFEDNVLKIGVLALDLRRRRCLVRGARVQLDARLFELLEALMRASGRVLSRAYLLETTWGMSPEARTRAIDVAISRLRKALGPRAGRWIETVERIGYRFRDPRDIAR